MVFPYKNLLYAAQSSLSATSSSSFYYVIFCVIQSAESDLLINWNLFTFCGKYNNERTHSHTHTQKKIVYKRIEISYSLSLCSHSSSAFNRHWSFDSFEENGKQYVMCFLQDSKNQYPISVQDSSSSSLAMSYSQYLFAFLRSFFVGDHQKSRSLSLLFLSRSLSLRFVVGPLFNRT